MMSLLTGWVAVVGLCAGVQWKVDGGEVSRREEGRREVERRGVGGGGLLVKVVARDRLE